MPSPTLLASADLCRSRRWSLGPVQPSRDWAAGLPPELISCILHRLDSIQITLGADFRVCRPWRRAARDEPELWRRIDMRGHGVLSDRSLVDLNQMAVDAVRRSRRRCQAFWGEGKELYNGFLRCVANQ
ncbi:F-box protein SKIP19-like [Panicum miliaceum]|uniref:F-box protein SKIP19-like n=1 Tax=Panicum miliaceum TaxID=4540 RepID=A0A3L6QS08_PANMI|nr:F-box protein SKIP19-like [Panicum miliaceum]